MTTSTGFAAVQLLLALSVVLVLASDGGRCVTSGNAVVTTMLFFCQLQLGANRADIEQKTDQRRSLRRFEIYARDYNIQYLFFFLLLEKRLFVAAIFSRSESFV